MISERKQAYNREYFRRYRLTDRGREAILRAGRKYRASDYGKQHACEYAQKYRQTEHGKEVHRKSVRTYQERHPEMKKLWYKKWRQSLKGKIAHLRAQQKYRQTERGRKVIYGINARYHLSEKGKQAKKRALVKYFSSERGKRAKKVIMHNRRVQLTVLNERLTVERIQQVYERNIKQYGTLTCDLCLKPIMFGEDTLEHYIPASRQDEFPQIDLNGMSNLGIAHRSCNCRKGKLTLEEYRQKYSCQLYSVKLEGEKI